MEIKEILTLVLFAVLTALNIVAFDRIGMLRKKTKKLEAEVNDCSLTAKEALDMARINEERLYTVKDHFKRLEKRFEEEIRENLEASAEKERKEADAEQLFIDGLRGIIDFDGGGKAKGEK